jgi:hypothetical protein
MARRQRHDLLLRICIGEGIMVESTRRLAGLEEVWILVMKESIEVT